MLHLLVRTDIKQCLYESVERIDILYFGLVVVERHKTKLKSVEDNADIRGFP